MARRRKRPTHLAQTVGKPKGKGVRPLPFRLQTPSRPNTAPRNPGCYTFRPVSGAYIRFRDTLGSAEYGLGHGLDGKGDWTLYVQGFGNYRHSDAVEALGWARAAALHGYVVTVTDRRVRT